MTRVLESKTAYKTALTSNIRAFDKAVQMEEEMERLEQLLLSLGAKIPEKRDKTVNS